jgi:hypothetical protein
LGISWDCIGTKLGLVWEFLKTINLNIPGIIWEYIGNIMGLNWE